MPIIKSAKKRVQQDKKRTMQNKHYKTMMLTMVKNITKWIKGGEVEKAVQNFDLAQKAIDTAVKRNIIHPNNGDRKKSNIAKAIKQGVSTHPESEKVPTKKTSTKKVGA